MKSLCGNFFKNSSEIIRTTSRRVLAPVDGPFKQMNRLTWDADLNRMNTYLIKSNGVLSRKGFKVCQ
jgi:hypothetical protein